MGSQEASSGDSLARVSAAEPWSLATFENIKLASIAMSIPRISKEVARRYVLGRQGLWPGRRWTEKDGTAQALRYIECVQMNPLNVIARSHDLALWGRVVNYQPDHLETLMYRDRQFFDYGSHQHIYPMSELPYWRVVMPRKGKEARWANFAKQHRALLEEVGCVWNANADAWTKLARAGYDVYRDYLNPPAFVDMLPDIEGLLGVDLGCGEGHNNEALAL